MSLTLERRGKTHLAVLILSKCTEFDNSYLMFCAFGVL